MDYPYYGKHHVEELIENTLPPGEEKGFDGRDPFIDTLAYALYLKEDGILLLEELRRKWPEAVVNYMKEAKEKARDIHPAWGEHHSAELISMTVPPGEKKHGFDDRLLFIETLTIAIALKEDGKILLEALRKKWSPEVESSMQEAEEIVSQMPLSD